MSPSPAKAKIVDADGNEINLDDIVPEGERAAEDEAAEDAEVEGEVVDTGADAETEAAADETEDEKA